MLMKIYIFQHFFVSILKKSLLFSKNTETDKVSVQFQIKVGYYYEEREDSTIGTYSFKAYGYSPNVLGASLGEIIPEKVYFFNPCEIVEIRQDNVNIPKINLNTNEFFVTINVYNDHEGNFNPTLWNNAYFKRLDTNQMHEHLNCQHDDTVTVIYKYEYSDSETYYIFNDEDIDKIIPVEFGVKEYIG